MLKISRLFVMGVLAVLCIDCAYAEDGDSVVKFSGFGSIGTVRSTLDDGDYGSNIAQPSGSGYTREWDFNSLTRLALQADINFTDQLSGVAQLISEYKIDNTFTPNFQLAFLQWKITPTLAARAGRLAFPTYLVSDYLKVSYAQPWVRPPDEIYYYVVHSHYDGADLTWRTNVGGTSLRLQALLGDDFSKSAPVYTDPVTNNNTNMRSVNVLANSGFSTYWLSYLKTQVTFDSPQIESVLDLIRFFGRSDIAAYLTPVKRRMNYLSLGYSYDPGQWFVMSEYTKLGGEFSFIPHIVGKYVTAGVRVNHFTPYVTLANLRGASPRFVPDPPTTLAVQIANSLIDLNMATQQRQSVGLRWDFAKNADVKVQFDHIKLGANSYGTLINLQNTFQSGRRYNVFSLVSEFVF